MDGCRKLPSRLVENSHVASAAERAPCARRLSCAAVVREPGSEIRNGVDTRTLIAAVPGAIVARTPGSDEFQ